MDDRERIFDFIEQDDPRAAIAVDERIAAQVLVQFPDGGRPGRIEETRELIVRRTPYIVAYRVGKDTFRFKEGATVHVRYTCVYEWVNGQWLVAHHHSSAMPEAR